MYKRILSIKFRVLALGVCLCLVGLLFRQFVALPRFQSQVQSLFASQQRDLANHVARDVAQVLDLRAALVRNYAADLPAALRERPTELQQWLLGRQHGALQFNGGLAVFDGDARLLAASGRAAPDLRGSAYAAEVLRTRGPLMSEPLPATAGGARAILFCQSLGGSPGMLCGVAMLGQSGFLDELLADQGGARSGLLLIAPRARLFLSASDPSLIMKATPAPGVNALHDRAMDGYRGTGMTVNARGVEELSAIASVGRSDWFVVARLPAAQAFAAVDDMREFMLQATAGVMLLLSTLLLIGLSYILRPLVTTARAIHEMGDGKRALEPLPVVRDDEVGKLVRVFNVLVDRLHKEEAARRASDARLLHLAHHDPLTGLINRAMLEQRLDQEQARCARNGLQMAVLFCDLDGFKAINDHAGHQTGDAVLRQVATRLSAARRKVDAVARLGGDEFVIVLSDLPDGRACAAIVAEQCLGDMVKPFEVEGRTFRLGMSIGVVVHRGLAVGAAALLAEADAAMYQSKRMGKGNYCFGQPAGVARVAG